MSYPKFAQLLFIVALSFFAHTVVWAAFDPAKANQTLDRLTVLLSTQSLTPEELVETQKRLVEEKRYAENCINEKTKELEELQRQLPEIPKDPETEITLTADQQYLFQKKVETENILSDCKLFNLRASELITLLSKEAKKKKQTRLLGTTEPLWQNLPIFVPRLKEWIEEINLKEIVNKSGYQTYTYADFLSIFILLTLAYFGGYYLKISMLEYIKRPGSKSEIERDFSAFLDILKNHVSKIFCFGILLLYETFHDYLLGEDLVFDSMIIPFFIYFVLVCVIDFLTHPPISNALFNTKGKSRQESFCNSLKAFVFLMLILYFCLSIEHLLPKDLILFQTLNAFFYTALAINFYIVIRAFVHLNVFFDTRPNFKVLVNACNIFLLTFNITCQWTGHIELSVYLLKGISFSIFYIALTLAAYATAKSILEKIFSQKHPWDIRAFRFIHLHRKELMLEFVTLKLTLFLVFWGWLIILLNDTWTISELWSLTVKRTIFEGFTVGESKIIPVRIVLGLLFFSLFTLCIRIIKNQLQPKEDALNKVEQEAYLIILGYIGIAFSIIMSLMIAGFQLQNLALIAGALSVGIGFGLQHIVNNFVSGIVLLLERPIRKGDRIVVGDKEGFVTKIGVRSTVVRTLEQSHVLVPNSDLVTKEVKNFMLSHKKARVRVEARVQFDTDINKVLEILREAAETHPDVITNKGDEPSIFCLGYYENALQFALLCTANNVNNRYQIRSDLYCFVDQRFREEGIKYAFIQADVHLKPEQNPPATPRDKE